MPNINDPALRRAPRASRIPRPARAHRLPARQRADRAEPVGGRPRPGRLPVPLPPHRGGAGDRARRRATLRTPEGERELEVGEVVRFARGRGRRSSDHQPLAGDARFLSTSTHGEPDIVFYPDSDKVGAAERLPRGGGVRLFFREGDARRLLRRRVTPLHQASSVAPAPIKSAPAHSRSTLIHADRRIPTPTVS